MGRQTIDSALILVCAGQTWLLSTTQSRSARCAVGTGADCRVHSGSSSWFGCRSRVNQGFHHSRVDKLIEILSGNDQALTCLSVGRHMSLYRPYTRSCYYFIGIYAFIYYVLATASCRINEVCLHDTSVVPCRNRMWGASHWLRPRIDVLDLHMYVNVIVLHWRLPFYLPDLEHIWEVSESLF